MARLCRLKQKIKFNDQLCGFSFFFSVFFLFLSGLVGEGVLAAACSVLQGARFVSASSIPTAFPAHPSPSPADSLFLILMRTFHTHAILLDRQQIPLKISGYVMYGFLEVGQAADALYALRVR